MVKTVAIVSLSSGILGERFVEHERKLGLARLRDYGIAVKFMDNACMGMAYLKEHPEKRAEDLLQAFRDPEVDMILCAIGGDDTYRLLPYLFDRDELKAAVSKKIFLGFSDTTMNHFMLHKVGLPTFYGQAFLPDVCELDREMLPYSRKYFEELISTGTIHEIVPSDLWYESRTDFGPEQLGTKLKAHPNQGFVLLQGTPVFSGEILGGCLDTMFDLFDNTRHADSPELCRKYDLFPQDWEGKILLLETSEEQMPPQKFEKAVMALKEAGVLSIINGILMGKPMDEVYAEAYQEILLRVIEDPKLPVVCNLNIGHALPRCIIPLGIPATVDTQNQTIRFS